MRRWCRPSWSWNPVGTAANPAEAWRRLAARTGDCRIAGLAERSKGFRDRIAPLLGGASSVMMSVVVSLPRRLLGILLDRGEVLLCGGEIARLKVRAKGFEGLCNSARACTRGGGALPLGLRKLLRQGNKV
jgi:hypothetical protein